MNVMVTLPAFKERAAERIQEINNNIPRIKDCSLPPVPNKVLEQKNVKQPHNAGIQVDGQPSHQLPLLKVIWS